MIIFKTTIGYGSPNKAGKSAAHGSPLGPDEIALTKKSFEWSHEEFSVPEEARAHFALAAKRGQAAAAEWTQKNSSLVTMLQKLESLPFIEEQIKGLPHFKVGEDFASREASGKVINAIAATSPFFFGGDADLSCSTNTFIKDGGPFEGQEGSGRNIHYGVREHAMGAIANGVAYHGGLRNYTATFFCFADYMKPAIRLAALNHLPVVFVFTHDSIGLGEDGPTHQPVEHLMSLRGIPNLITLRPADSNETREAWIFAMNHRTGPVALVLSRQKLKTIDRTIHESEKGLHQGAYVLSDRPHFSTILVATGSEVGLALETQNRLDAKGISVRVVSMPSLELFLKQPKEYREKIIPSSIQKVASIEAGITLGWAEITGREGLNFGVNDFGSSAPASKIYEKFGLTADAMAARIIEWAK